MVHENCESLTDAAVELAGDPGDQTLRRALCVELERCLQPFLLRCIHQLTPWYLDGEVSDILQGTLCGVFKKAIRLCEGGRLDTTQGAGKLASYFRVIARNEM